MSSDLIFISSLFISLLGLMVSGILYFANKDQSLTPRILAAVLACISYSLMAFAWNFSGTYLLYPHLWRTAVVPSFSIPVLSYLYVRSVLEQQFRFRKRDFFLFIPVILYALQMAPFYVLRSSEKLELIRRTLTDRSLIAAEPEGMLPPGWGITLRMILSLALVVAQIVLILTYRRKMVSEGRLHEQNNQIYHWLLYFSVVMGSTFFVLLFEFLFQMSRYVDIWALMTATVGFNIVFICFFLLFRPNILYGLRGWLQVGPNILETVDNLVVSDVTAEEETEARKKQTLSLDQGKLYKQVVEQHFKENHPYRKHGYTIRDLSNELSIPTYQLSVFINQEYGKNFNEFVNDNRVGYLEQLVKVEPEHLQYTLEALGQMAGFNSRTAFISAVKRKTGKTPSELFGKKYGR